MGAGIGAAGSVFGGIQAAKAGREEAKRAGIDTVKQAKARGEEIDKLQGKQTLDFLSSGVLLEGSPLLALQETQEKGSEEITEGIQAGFREASKARRAGRDALIGSVFQAGGKLLSTGGGGGGSSEPIGNPLKSTGASGFSRKRLFGE